ncbi:MAG: FAD-dependent oxidoreductase [Firmicutes bacterium]|nr:FAD-dependent oxidoreductase [Erysipelotrichaceae bacterium]MDD6525022.1 FAD-dependent oxidoreductase [Bacillota bacterium]MDY4972658.1 FAD-dependent oxidoreductase [Erysipelotrichaceae bacterium]MDY5997248.1 FAD-dependent oxidoreductase [Erysipelotrichaceae bacterium]
MENFDVVIIGGGIGGLMCAYRLIEKKPDLKIVLFERGHGLQNRRCPIVAKKTKYCVKCDPCNIMEGMGGAGAFSDGKYIISSEYGGWLPDVMDSNEVIDYIEQADKILVSFGATTERYKPSDELKRECIKYDLHMQQAQVKHLGTDANFDTMVKMVNYLEDKISIRTLTTVIGVDKDKMVVKAKDKNGEYEVSGKKIIFAVGRAGSRVFASWCKENNIKCTNNQVDIGVRVELPAMVWEHFSKKIYEPKIFYRSKQYGDVTRMFCFNERGHVVTENTDGVLTVNGHSFKDEAKKSTNSNFALLSTTKFTEPFNEPIEYARYVASLANKISGGSVLVQRLGDLESGRRTDAKRLKQSTVRPTLDAVPGDLSLCMPKRQLDNIIETLHALDAIAPGTANYDTLLYGIECKFYSARPECENFELINARGIYALGDGAGFTRSLSQAAANGLIVADNLIKLF